MPLLPDEPNNEEKLEQLPEDSETPFRPANSDSQLDDTHPVTDSNMQEEEQYEGGVADAAEAEETSPGIPHIADADHS